jgi:membrane protein implicated in regulation of membrane protease activity
MEFFATFGLIVLVGLAIPITLLFAALVFDFVLVIYAMLATKRIRRRKPRSIEGAVGGDRESESRGIVVFDY